MLDNQKRKINVAIVGVGNCASALVQGVNYYREHNGQDIPGIMFPNIGGYTVQDLNFVAAWDVDARKVGLPLNEAIFAEPNCCRVFQTNISDDCIVNMGSTLDGISDHMLTFHKKIHFQVADNTDALLDDVVKTLTESKADILLNYLPVGSQLATEFYMNAAIKAGVAVVNCIPVFIASDPVWEQKFIDAKLPIIGDDMRSQVGASVLSQVLQELAYDRGCKVNFHQQLNVGGNSDFANMMNAERIVSKRISKENVIRSQNDLRNIEVAEDSLYAGPSSFVPYLKDNKVAYIRMELEAFGGANIEIDVKLSVQDSENSAGVVLDAVRYLQVAKEMGIVGSLRGPSAWTQKTPPEQMMYRDSLLECEMLARREYTELTCKQKV